MKTNSLKKELQALQKEWYQKLKESGFKDAEQESAQNAEPYLKEWHSCYFSERHHPTVFQIKHEYFYRAEQFLNDHNFSSETEREIWRLHSEGVSYREIAKRLGNKKRAHLLHCRPHQCDIFCSAASSDGLDIGALNKDKAQLVVTRLKEVMKAQMKLQECEND